MTDITSLIPTHVERAGSGALVSIGSIHGILTAAHVLEELPDSGEVGLIRFTREPKLQTQTIDMSLAEKLTIGAVGKAAGRPREWKRC